MAKKILYKAGDIVKIPLAENKFGFGRILIVQSPALLIGLYDCISNNTIDIEILNDKKYLLKKMCGDLGIKRKEWIVIGNIPLDIEEKLPYFWDKNALTGKLYIRKYNNTNKDPLGLGNGFIDKPTTEKEIKEKEAQPDGLCGWKALEAVLKHHLEKAGILK